MIASRIVCVGLAAATTVLGQIGEESTQHSRKIDALQVALDDEVISVKTYQAVLDRFGPVEPFASIIVTEREHVRMLTTAMERISRESGTPAPQSASFDATTAPIMVPETLQEACQQALANEADSANLFMSRLVPVVAGDADVLALFSELEEATEQHHIAAFRRCAR